MGDRWLFRDFRHDLPVLAETSGKNAMVITPSADLDLAVKDLVASAFGHAGQKCSAASLAILVGPVARSKRFLGQLVDAVGSLEVGAPWTSTTRMGPLIEPASGKLLEGLTTLGEGEQWLLEPKRLDREGRLWTPGIRSGVRRGSAYHLTEYFGPVLGIMTATDLDEAIAIQNEVAYGLTAGLQSLEPTEIATWIEGVDSGNLYVNRGTTGANGVQAEAVRRLEAVLRRRGYQGRRPELPHRPRRLDPREGYRAGERTPRSGGRQGRCVRRRRSARRPGVPDRGRRERPGRVAGRVRRHPRARRSRCGAEPPPLPHGPRDGPRRRRRRPGRPCSG